MRARALRLAGELGRSDLPGAGAAGTEDTEAGCRFWAAWAAALLGERRRALPALESEVAGGGPQAARALEVGLRVMDRAQATDWLRRLKTDPANIRLVVAGAGIIGDPAILPWLIRQMEDPALARLAGESFSMITGADLEAEGLAAAAPEAEAPGDDAAARHDDGLPVPDTAAVRGWWQRNSGNLQDGGRYLGGKPIAPSGLQEVLATGPQRQRLAAALELALKRPEAPLFEVRARGRLQQRALREAPAPA